MNSNRQAGPDKLPAWMVTIVLFASGIVVGQSLSGIFNKLGLF